jgi:transposase-like protein
MSPALIKSERRALQKVARDRNSPEFRAKIVNDALPQQASTFQVFR